MPYTPLLTSATIAAIFGAAMLVPPTPTHALAERKTSPTPAFAATSGTWRHVGSDAGHDVPVINGCHAGRAKWLDRPPPPAPPLPPQAAKLADPSQSFQTGSFPTECREVPPTPVTLGSSAGESTARLAGPLPPAKQSSEPLSPDAATTV